MKSRKTIATPPGATIKEQLDDRGMTQKEFAQRMDLSEKHISRLINGEVHLTPDVALRLEHVLGIPAQFWINLEALFREKCARAEEENAMDSDMELAKKIPYAEMVKKGWIAPTASAEERVRNLRSFFCVAKLEIIDNILIPGIAYRRTEIKDSSIYALAVWAQKAKLIAANMQVGAINIQRLIKELPAIRRMSAQSPKAFLPRLTELLKNCGIALVLLPHMQGSFLHGASFYDGKKIVLGVTLRGQDADKFWFSLFHEISHIILGHLGRLEPLTEEEEREADALAEDILIPEDQYRQFVSLGLFSERKIKEFAKQLEIDPGIVVGRLQNDDYLKFSQCNQLKKKYVFGEPAGME